MDRKAQQSNSNLRQKALQVSLDLWIIEQVLSIYTFIFALLSP